MPRIITYCLKPATSNSDEYHCAISDFADSWLAASIPQVTDLIHGFRRYRRERGVSDRSDAEYAFELLSMGVLLREHGRAAARLPGPMARLLAWLVEIQNRRPRLEKPIKRLRGWLGWAVSCIPFPERTADPIGLLLAWLSADGESVKHQRLAEWHAWFQSTSSPSTIPQLAALARNFAASSLTVLGKYTENVDHFLSSEAPSYRRRYDARLVSRTRLEYHLAMLGTEILNRAYRQRFLATGRKVVILPPCMCAPAEACQARETPFGAQCQACTPGCRVHQITKLGEKLGFAVTMIPDDVKVFDSQSKAGPTGLVGVSCALTNWNGGWDADGAGIPAQGLLLDYAGCKYHWDPKGIPTDTNLKRLQEILAVSTGGPA
jgi:uncharacterized protein